MLGLAGCRLDVDVDTTVRADGTGLVRVTVRADAELLGKVPGLLADLRLDDLRSTGWTVTGPTSASDGSATLTVTKGFSSPAGATAVLAEITGPHGVLQDLRVTQDRSFAVVETGVSGQASLSGLSDFSDAQLAAALRGVPLADRVSDQALRQGLGFTVRYQLPGSVQSSTGTVEGSTVSWTPSLAPGAKTSLDATARSVDRTAENARTRETWARRAFWVWIGVVVLIAAAAVVFIAIRRRRTRSHAASQ